MNKFVSSSKLMGATDAERVAKLLLDVASEAREPEQTSDRLRQDVELLSSLVDEARRQELLRTLFVRALRN